MDCCTPRKQGDKDTGVTREGVQFRGWGTCLLSMLKALSFITRAKGREGKRERRREIGKKERKREKREGRWIKEK